MDQDVREFLEQMAGMMAREFARINRRLDDIDARLDSHDRRLNRLEALCYDLRGEMTLVRQSIDGLTLRVEALQQRA